MTNAWSLLYDTMTKSLGEDVYEQILKENYDWGDDGYSVTGNPAPPSGDTIILGGNDDGCISFGAAQPVPYDSFMGIGEDTISFDYEPTTNMNRKSESNNRQKYSEDVIIKELKDYITRTYDQHYSAGDDKIQTLDLIEACGDGEAFCRSNILKYASRYDKKGTARRDIMKILHYAVLLMHFNDKNANRETYPQ